MILTRVRDCIDVEDLTIPVEGMLKREPRCKICRSKWSWAVSRMLLKGATYQDVVDKYKDRIENLNVANISRHFTKHCNPRAFALRTIKRKEWLLARKSKAPVKFKKLYEQKASEYENEFVDEKVGLDVLIRDSFERVTKINEEIDEKDTMIRFLDRSMEDQDIKMLEQERRIRGGLIEIRERVISNLINALEKKSKIGQPSTVINYNTLILDMKGLVDDVISILLNKLPENYNLRQDIVRSITGRIDKRFGKMIAHVPEVEVIK